MNINTKFYNSPMSVAQWITVKYFFLIPTDDAVLDQRISVTSN